MACGRGRDINNPKVPLSYVRKHGKLLYSSVGENLEDTISWPQRSFRFTKGPF